MSVRVLPSGERALLVEVADAGAAHRLASHARTHAAVVEEAVAGARTVLLVARPGTEVSRLREVFSGAPTTTAASAPPGEVRIEVRIEVRYDGADLAEVADAVGLSTAEVVRRHSAARYVVEFVGFAPGFGYLTGLDPILQLPRRTSPRPSVPAGSVAIAGPYSAVYPRESPGGWHLLGSTDTVLFDPAADPPSPLVAGTVVRFVPR